MYKLLAKGTVEEAMNRCAESKLKLEEDVTGMGRGKSLLISFQQLCTCHPQIKYSEQHVEFSTMVSIRSLLGKCTCMLIFPKFIFLP